MGFILDIPLCVTVEVGRTKLLVEELLQLGQGSVIELDKQILDKLRDPLMHVLRNAVAHGVEDPEASRRVEFTVVRR